MSEVAICPVEDCKLTVDIVLKSSDGELFGAHQQNLEIYTEGFPIAGSTTSSAPVSLEETAAVLRLMLRYTHHTRPPNLDDISFTLLSSLAEAVEKYTMYSAMEFCKIKMTHAMDDYPNEVFLYSVRHNYPDLADKAAKLTLKNSVSDFLVLIREGGLHGDTIIRWLRYRDCWMETLVRLPTDPSVHLYKELQAFGDCEAWNYFQLEVLGEVRRDLSSLNRIIGIVNKYKGRLNHCQVCLPRSISWALQVKAEVEILPKYSEV